MKKAVATSLKRMVENECARLGIPYQDYIYRRAKKAYNKATDIQKSKFRITLVP